MKKHTELTVLINNYINSEIANFLELTMTFVIRIRNELTI